MKRALAGLVAPFAVLAFAASAPAADQVYWGNFASNKISHANLDGSGGIVNLNTGSATVSVPYGLAIDQVGGRVYWANVNGSKISYANLDGSGGGDLATAAATVSLPTGVAIDPATRRIYWANEEGNKPISYANLDGSGGADVDVTGASVGHPVGVALDPGARRLYWTNATSAGSISYVGLDGGGAHTLPISGSATLEYPYGLAIDSAAQKIYWTNDNIAGNLSVANLDGSGSHDLNTTGLAITAAYGAALDPETGRLYWGNTGGQEAIGFLRLDEAGGGGLPLSIPKNSGPDFPVLLKTPRGTAVPALRRADLVAKPKSKGRKSHPPSRVVGTSLGCLPGTWAGDLVGAFLYRAPTSTSIQWTRDGSPIAGETGPLLSARAVGDYRCRETATNWAGTGTQLSPVAALFKVGQAKTNPRKGTARLAVELPPAGVLALSGKGVAGATLTAAGKQTVPIGARGAARRRLASTGSATVGLKLTFTPAEGPPVSQITKVALRETSRR